MTEEHSVQPSAPVAPRSVRPPTLPFLLIAAGLIAYENSMPGVFVFDDDPCIINNDSLRSLRRTWNAGPEDIPGGLQRRVVGRWTFALNYAAGGLDVWGYHLVNVCIHILAALLLMGIVRRTLERPGRRSSLQEHAPLLAFSVALIWLVHPIQTESVTYIVQRLESLMGMFFLASLYALIKSDSERGRVWQVLAVLAGWLCIGTKEVGLMLPPVAILFDRVFLSASWKEVFRRRGVVHFVLITAMAVYFVVGIGNVPVYIDRPDAGERATSWEYLRSQPGVLLHYVAISFWPRDLCLDLLWPIAKDPWEIYGKGALIVATLIAGFTLLRYRPAVGFLIIAFFVILAPSSTVVPLHLAFEHRMYLSLACLIVGVIVSIFLLAEFLLRASRQPAAAASICVLGITIPIAMTLTMVTRHQNEIYHSRVTVWQNVVRIAPHNPRAHMNLAGDLTTVGRFAEAEKHYKIAIRVKPSFAMGHHNYGVFLDNDLSQPERALEHLEEAVRLEPQNEQYAFALAAALENVGNVDAAEELYRQAIDVNPDYYAAHHNLGRLLRLEKQFTVAEQYLSRAVELGPGQWLTHRELAKLSLDQSEDSKALEHYLQAVATCKPGTHWVLKQELAWLFATSQVDALRDGSRALELAESIVSEQEEESICWDTLGVAQAELGQFDDAITSAEKAIGLAESADKSEESVEAIRLRVERYRRHEPIRE